MDIVLGPVLTLAVFKPGKPRLKFDMTVIALLQISALISGVWIVHSEHPMLVVFAEDTLHPIPAYQVAEAGIPLSSLKQFGNARPIFVYTDLPEDEDELQKLRIDAIRTGRNLYLYGELYQALNKDNIKKINKQGIDMEEFLNDKPAGKQIYQDFLKEYGGKAFDYLFLPLHSRFQWHIIAVDPETIEYVDTLPIHSPTYELLKGSKAKKETK